MKNLKLIMEKKKKKDLDLVNAIWNKSDALDARTMTRGFSQKKNHDKRCLTRISNMWRH